MSVWKRKIKFIKILINIKKSVNLKKIFNNMKNNYWWAL